MKFSKGNLQSAVLILLALFFIYLLVRFLVKGNQVTSSMKEAEGLHMREGAVNQTCSKQTKKNINNRIKSYNNCVPLYNSLSDKKLAKKSLGDNKTLIDIINHNIDVLQKLYSQCKKSNTQLPPIPAKILQHKLPNQLTVLPTVPTS